MTDLGYVTDGSDTSSAARRQGGLVHDGAERLQLSRAPTAGFVGCWSRRMTAPPSSQRA